MDTRRARPHTRVARVTGLGAPRPIRKGCDGGHKGLRGHGKGASPLWSGRTTRCGTSLHDRGNRRVFRRVRQLRAPRARLPPLHKYHGARMASSGWLVRRGGSRGNTASGGATLNGLRAPGTGAANASHSAIRTASTASRQDGEHHEKRGFFGDFRGSSHRSYRGFAPSGQPASLGRGEDPMRAKGRCAESQDAHCQCTPEPVHPRRRAVWGMAAPTGNSRSGLRSRYGSWISFLRKGR